jgi:hypothetical protein
VRYSNKRIEEHLNASLADRTSSLTYNNQCNQFLMFAFWTCGAKPFLPTSDALLCQYVEWQIGSVDPKNLGGYLSAIRNFHLLESRFTLLGQSLGIVASFGEL